jgi:futalosine hydrolase
MTLLIINGLDYFWCVNKQILLLVASKSELAGLLNVDDQALQEGVLTSFELNNYSFYYLVTGIGSVATTFHLTNHLASKKFDLVINLGVAGTFDRSIVLTEVVNVVQDQFADIGAQDQDEFIDQFRLGLVDPQASPYVNGVISPFHESNLATLKLYKQVKAITVNTVHGNQEAINKVIARLNPQVESMEGAAVFYVCSLLKVPSIQLRAISNYVEPRNRESWKIKEALSNLKLCFEKLIAEIYK